MATELNVKRFDQYRKSAIKNPTFNFLKIIIIIIIIFIIIIILMLVSLVVSLVSSSLS